MFLQFDSKVARWAAASLAAYFIFSVVAFNVGIGDAEFLLIPVAFMMLAPTPLLLKIGLAERGWLLSGPTFPGVIFLVIFYLALAYLIGGYVGYSARSGSRDSA